MDNNENNSENNKKSKLINRLKQFLVFVLIVMVVGGIYLMTKLKNDIVEIADYGIIDTWQRDPFHSCYYRASKTDGRFYDIAWLKLNILDTNVSGEFRYLPAEKDSKVGRFTGTVEPLDQKAVMGRKANVWWNTLAEGINTKEELIIEFGNGKATVGFGEMKDQGDGVYVYKNKNKLTYMEAMDQIDCDSLNEKLFVEKYIRDNIRKIATNEPVLGGSWYIVNVLAHPETQTAEVVYEDGHIESRASLSYLYEKNPQSVTIEKFEIKK